MQNAIKDLLDKVAKLVFGGERIDDLFNDNHAVVHVQPRHGEAVGGLSEIIYMSFTSTVPY